MTLLFFIAWLILGAKATSTAMACLTVAVILDLAACD